METITVKQLAKEAAKLVKAGYGDKKIMITTDDECNGVHELFQMFSRLDEENMIPLPYGVSEEEAINDYLILG